MAPLQLQAMLTFQQVDHAHALDPLPLLKLVPFGTLPPDAVGCTIPGHSQVSAQFHMLYMCCGGLRRLHGSCQG